MEAIAEEGPNHLSEEGPVVFVEEEVKLVAELLVVDFELLFGGVGLPVGQPVGQRVASGSCEVDDVGLADCGPGAVAADLSGLPCESGVDLSGHRPPLLLRGIDECSVSEADSFGLSVRERVLSFDGDILSDEYDK